MKQKLMFTFACFAFACFTGCKDIFEEDLTGFGVVLLSPPDGHTTVSNVTQFRWEAVPRANGYRIQIAEPDLANAIVYLHDSLVTTTTFTTSLAPGSYHWRVRGENENSETSYYERSLIITEATTLDGLTPLLISPAPNAMLSNDTVHYNWEVLAGADDYRFELRSGDQNGSLIIAQIIAGTLHSSANITDGLYAWGVQGQNNNSSSEFSYRSFTLDRSVPSAPVLTYPNEGTILQDTVFTFQWQSGIDATTSTTDSFFVYNSNDQLIRAISTTATSLSDSLGVGDFSWFVRTIDAAGNGTSSTEATFTIQ